MKKALPFIIVAILIIIIAVVVINKRKKATLVKRSPEELKAAQRKDCPKDAGWKSDAALNSGYYVPVDDESWKNYGFKPESEMCEILGWMTEITMAKDRGTVWPNTDTNRGLAHAAAYQLAKQKGRI